MTSLKTKAWRALLGDSDPLRAGAVRSFRGLRQANRQELWLGLALVALGYLRRTRPRRELIHRQVVKDGDILVIHPKSPDEPKLRIRKK
ncbi:MAG: hypothetical protein ACE5F5_12645 [Acidimicrobiia bacterium]